MVSHCRSSRVAGVARSLAVLQQTSYLLAPPCLCVWKENGILSEPMSNTVSLYLTVLCGGGKESLETTEGRPLEVLNSKLVSQEAQW